MMLDHPYIILPYLVMDTHSHVSPQLNLSLEVPANHEGRQKTRETAAARKRTGNPRDEHLHHLRLGEVGVAYMMNVAKK